MSPRPHTSSGRNAAASKLHDGRLGVADDDWCHACMSGTTRIDAPSNKNGLAPTARPSAKLAAASHPTRRAWSCIASQTAPSASMVRAYPQLMAAS